MMKQAIMGCLMLGLWLGVAGCGQGNEESIKALQEQVDQHEQELAGVKQAQEKSAEASQIERDRLEKENLALQDKIAELALELVVLDEAKSTQADKLVNLREQLEALMEIPPLPEPQARPKLDDVYEANKDSVVVLSANRLRGTGFIFTESGYVISNGHLAGSTVPYKVDFINGDSYPCRRLVSTRKTDLALFKIEADRTFTPVKFGDSSKVIPGEAVLAMGNGKGFGVTATGGVVGALNRTMTTDYGHMTGLIQIDAGVTDGYSGGPLFNQQGEVIGLIACTAGTHVNFAININLVKSLFPEMLKIEGRHGYVLGLKVAAEGEAEIIEVTADSPAESGGLKTGDLVTEVAGLSVSNNLDFYVAMLDRKAGDILSFKVQRDGTLIDTSITLGEIEPRPAEDIKGLVSGVNFEYYEGKWTELPDFDELEPVKTGVTNTITAKAYQGKDHFGLRFSGYIKVPESGTYTFSAVSDDGSQIYIGDQLVVDNDGLHAVMGRREFVALEAGWHPVTVTFFEGGGSEHLAIFYEGPGIKRRPVPKDALFHKK